MKVHREEHDMDRVGKGLFGAIARSAAPVLLAGALVMGGCASTDGGTGATAKPAATAKLLGGGQWDIKTIGGQAVMPNVAVNITFEDGRVFGAGSCNRFMGSYTPGPDFKVQMSQMASTMMACEDGRMQQEMALLGILADVTGYAVDASGVLILSTDDGRTITAQRAPA
jgi:heat shock protein HslJ